MNYSHVIGENGEEEGEEHMSKRDLFTHKDTIFHSQHPRTNVEAAKILCSRFLLLLLLERLNKHFIIPHFFGRLLDRVCATVYK